MFCNALYSLRPVNMITNIIIRQRSFIVLQARIYDTGTGVVANLLNDISTIKHNKLLLLALGYRTSLMSFLA